MADLNEFGTFDEDDMEGFYETLITTDEDGQDLDVVVIDSIRDGNATYLLVIEASQAEDDDPEAIILKETKEENDEYVYDVLEDETEFERIAALFQDNGEDYEIEYD